MDKNKRIAPGDRLPFFEYDTPYTARNSFRALLTEQAPLVLVFMSNFGHPITRTFVQRYAATYDALESGGLAMVVRSRPERLAGSVPEGTIPFPVLCDAEGVLYDYLDIPRRKSTLQTCSLEAWSILRRAKKQGYQPPKGALQQMPLTLILDENGTVLFRHYGASLTDVPADCEAMEKLIGAVLEMDGEEPEIAQDDGYADELYDEAVDEPGDEYDGQGYQPAP